MTLRELEREQEAALLEQLKYEVGGTRSQILNLQGKTPSAAAPLSEDTITRAGRNDTGPNIGFVFTGLTINATINAIE